MKRSIFVLTATLAMNSACNLALAEFNPFAEDTYRASSAPTKLWSFDDEDEDATPPPPKKIVHQAPKTPPKKKPVTKPQEKKKVVVAKESKDEAKKKLKPVHKEEPPKHISIAHPEQQKSPAQEKPDSTEAPKVFFVGGYLANPNQMRCWEQGATRNASTHYEFEGIPYPAGAGAGREEAIAGASRDIRRIVDEINANPSRHYVIAGHSSGAAISNEIARRASYPLRLKLVDLDGFVPSKALRDRIPETTCWTSRTENGLHSRNYDAMKNCGEKMREQVDNHCHTRWCLHFTLVIESTPANLGTDYPSRGYNGCNTNVNWLE